MASSAPGELGRERDDPHRPGREQRRELVAVGRPQVLGGLDAAAALAQPRAFEMDAEEPGLGDRGHGPQQRAGRRGERGGEQRGRPVLRVEARGGEAFLRVARHEVRAPAPVDVEVDEAGREQPAVEVDALARRGRLAVADRLDAPGRHADPGAGEVLVGRQHPRAREDEVHQIRRSGSVSSPPASPVLTVPSGSIRSTCVSSSARGQCSTPRGTT